MRVPMLVRWKGVIEAGSVYSPPVSTIDLLPTIITSAGARVDDSDNLDGVDLLPYLLGEKSGCPHEFLFWKKENRGAVRAGKWKFLRFPDRPAELYDVENDVAEVNNLAAANPEVVRALYKRLFEWELTLQRPAWQLLRKYEGAAMKRMDDYRKTAPQSPSP